MKSSASKESKKTEYEPDCLLNYIIIVKINCDMFKHDTYIKKT